MAVRKGRLPVIADVEEMPRPRRGRPNGLDLAPLADAIQDRRPHALEGVGGDEDRRFWRRKLRQAARLVDLRVETSYQPSEKRLYFQGVDSEDEVTAETP